MQREKQVVVAKTTHKSRLPFEQIKVLGLPVWAVVQNLFDRMSQHNFLFSVVFVFNFNVLDDFLELLQVREAID